MMVVVVLAGAGTLFVTLMAITFCLAGGANSSPAEIRVLKTLIIGCAVLGISGVTAGIFLMRAGHFRWALFAALAPAVIMILAFIVALILEV